MHARLLELGALPRAAKLGVVVIVAGLLVDAWVHTLGVVTAGSALALIVQQHLAHLVVLVGMVMTLAGIVVDGVRRGRLDRPGRRTVRALR
jgi:hypothetical protein